MALGCSIPIVIEQESGNPPSHPDVKKKPNQSHRIYLIPMRQGGGVPEDKSQKSFNLRCIGYAVGLELACTNQFVHVYTDCPTVKAKLPSFCHITPEDLSVH